VTKIEHLRCAFDTNVLISAALFPYSLPGRALVLARKSGVLLASRELAEEVRNVLSRPKFSRYVSQELRDEFLVTFVADAEFVEITEHVDVCRDPADNKILEVAANGRATCLISGDNDLLALHPFHDIPILNPADFLARYSAAQP
jgi:putative PIN family toxin of toxin-antitoxin system